MEKLKEQEVYVKVSDKDIVPVSCLVTPIGALVPQSKILHSKEELREFAKKIWRESARRSNYENCDDKHLVYGDEIPPDFESFINQILEP